MALCNSESRVLLPGKQDDDTSSFAAHQGLRRTAIAWLWMNWLNQTTRRRLTRIGPMRMVDAIAIQDAFHRADVVPPRSRGTSNGASGARL